MANLATKRDIFAGSTSDIDTTARNTVGVTAYDTDGNEYIYLLGVASTTAGSWVSYNATTFQTALLAANAVGDVAIAMAAVLATQYGWYQIKGINTIAKTDTIAADKALFIDGTAGRADDAVVTGDLIVGATSVTADTSNVATVRLNYPKVNDVLG